MVRSRLTRGEKRDKEHVEPDTIELRMTREELENLVKEAVASLPQEYLQKLSNVDIVVEEWPSSQILASLGIPTTGWLFGLYQGTPLIKRTSGSVLPDKITLFAGPILTVSRSPDEVRERIASVVKHEIAHHFGLDERRIRRTGH